MDPLVDDTANAIVTISARLTNSFRRSLRTAKASGAASVLLELDQYEDTYSLVDLMGRARRPIDKIALRSLRTLVKVMIGSEGFGRADTLGSHVALELETGRTGTGIDRLYAYLNHHNSATRDYAIDLAWLARARLKRIRAAKRILFNVGASHLYADKRLGVSRGMCVDERLRRKAEACVKSDARFVVAGIVASSASSRSRSAWYSVRSRSPTCTTH